MTSATNQILQIISAHYSDVHIIRTKLQLPDDMTSTLIAKKFKGCSNKDLEKFETIFKRINKESSILLDDMTVKSNKSIEQYRLDILNNKNKKEYIFLNNIIYLNFDKEWTDVI